MTHVILTLTRVEAAHLADLVGQFQTLVTESDGDPAVERLTPDVYPEDADASGEFRRATRDELLGRRAHDAATVAADLARIEPASVDEALSPVDVSIADLEPWLRTLSAVRLVLASRLGITDDGEHDEDDPAYGLYEWLGYRLEGLVQVAENES
ncbi:hypothetical protein GCM10010910_09060 [Microbacterium nanhaiense]|uniref:DUF2017 domain-containing protein n=1 Tax=Microbacterium nanhaiense TaxID=1301026 RepID=A0ABQ2N037_9MICO|nr:DUF2017 family protein [Microbacterium nanhaiense]GGO61382.1 hypothetical protein GCM10010910_09060 [Microbacterium nanhaiense]